MVARGERSGIEGGHYLDWLPGHGPVSARVRATVLKDVWALGRGDEPKASEEEIANAKTALERAQTRLQKGRDDLPMPEGCVLC